VLLFWVIGVSFDFYLIGKIRTLCTVVVNWSYLGLEAWLCMCNRLWDKGFDNLGYFWLYLGLESVVLGAICHYNWISTDCMFGGIFLGMNWHCFGIMRVWQWENSASLSRLGESYRTSRLVWGRTARSSDLALGLSDLVSLVKFH